MNTYGADNLTLLSPHPRFLGKDLILFQLKYGKARVEPVMAKIMAELPEYRGKASEIKRMELMRQ